MKINLMICGAALMMLAATACSPSPYTLTSSEQGTAELGARDFFERSGGKFTGCSGQDSDRDNYVTCSGEAKNGTGQDMLCSYKENARGCKRKAGGK